MTQFNVQKQNLFQISGCTTRARATVSQISTFAVYIIRVALCRYVAFIATIILRFSRLRNSILPATRRNVTVTLVHYKQHKYRQQATHHVTDDATEPHAVQAQDKRHYKHTDKLEHQRTRK